MNKSTFVYNLKKIIMTSIDITIYMYEYIILYRWNPMNEVRRNPDPTGMGLSIVQRNQRACQNVAN